MYNEDGIPEYSSHLCKLDSGEIVSYDFCLEIEYAHAIQYKNNKSAWKYIGKGTIYSLNGIEQKLINKNGPTHYFYQYA